jgi:voltage-gated potassium channel Kch
LLREAPRAASGRNVGSALRWAAVLWRWQRGVLASIPRPIRIMLAGLAVIAVVSVFLFEWIMKLSPVDAFYFLVATLTTTGYGDISFSRAPWQLKLYGSLLMLSGGLLMATVVSVMTDLLVSLRLRDVLAERRMPASPHVIVAGLGNVGHRIVRELLDSGESVVVITQDADDEHTATLGGTVLIVVGDPAREECLKQAGLGRAKAVVAVTEDDVINLGIAIRAKTINPAVRTVIRIFDATLAEKLQRDLSLDSVMSVSAVSAPTLVAVALHPDARYATIWQNHLLTVFHDHGGTIEPDAMAWVQSAAVVDIRLRLGHTGDDVRPELLPPENRGPAGDDVLRIRGSPLQLSG